MEKEKKQLAIEVRELSKTFRIPHEKHTTLKQVAVNAFQKKSYEVFSALKDVNFSVEQGEFFGIIGKNGSGKSTLLKILAGIYVKDKGKIEINGKLSPFLELGVGFNPELTARENVFLGGVILGLTRKELEEKVDDIIEFAELKEFEDMKFKNFSSGMQVRLAFALSINAHAEILLMDEVLAVGDSNFQLKCLNEFKKYKKEGKTVVLVSHDINTVQKYCDRVMLMVSGNVAMVGDAKKVTGEYIRQNIEDLNKGEHLSDLPQGHKKAEITGVTFYDSKGKSTEIFESGEDITVRVNFKKDKNVKELNFGLALLNHENHYVLGINSFVDKVDTKKILAQGYYEVVYKKIPIREGIYFVKAGVWGKDSDDMIDFLDSSGFFSVTPNDNNQGMIALDYEWK